jgi:hypothetical protein
MRRSPLREYAGRRSCRKKINHVEGQCREIIDQAFAEHPDCCAPASALATQPGLEIEEVLAMIR